MEKSEYLCCDVCETEIFCGVQIDFQTVGSVSVLCKECSLNYTIVVKNKNDKKPESRLECLNS